MRKIPYYRKKTPEYKNYHKENMDRREKLELQELREKIMMSALNPNTNRDGKIMEFMEALK